jgi:hypothetical protein
MNTEDYAAIERHIREQSNDAVPEPPDGAQVQDRTVQELKRAIQRSRPKHFTQGEKADEAR